MSNIGLVGASRDVVYVESNTAVAEWGCEGCNAWWAVESHNEKGNVEY